MAVSILYPSSKFRWKVYAGQLFQPRDNFLRFEVEDRHIVCDLAHGSTYGGRRIEDPQGGSPPPTHLVLWALRGSYLDSWRSGRLWHSYNFRTEIDAFPSWNMMPPHMRKSRQNCPQTLPFRALGPPKSSLEASKTPFFEDT